MEERVWCLKGEGRVQPFTEEYIQNAKFGNLYSTYCTSELLSGTTVGDCGYSGQLSGVNVC